MKRLVTGLGLLAVLLAACSPPTAPPTAPLPAAASEEAVDLAPRPHRDEPAPYHAFRADDAQWVASTGKPQLLEFYAEW